jgi:hypothetical protein
MRRLFLFLVAALTLLAADATGRWKGELITTGDGGEQSHPAMVVLKQDGTALTGTAGPEDDQNPIEKGRVDDGVITFELSRDGGVMRFNLKQNGDEIAGEVTREREGQTQRARLVLKREK